MPACRPIHVRSVGRRSTKSVGAEDVRRIGRGEAVPGRPGGGGADRGGPGRPAELRPPPTPDHHHHRRALPPWPPWRAFGEEKIAAGGTSRPEMQGVHVLDERAELAATPSRRRRRRPRAISTSVGRSRSRFRRFLRGSSASERGHFQFERDSASLDRVSLEKNAMNDAG